ncbi:hypothetical protein, partial [Streptosporangium sp. NPDC048865]|uniref:hypothetical protein n=1 Tax=Streptosporangium sp. NPDC048865 TaxID=3155766 RepID=UPI0034140A5F
MVTYRLVQVVEAPGASVATGHVTADGIPVPENAVLVTPRPVKVALPVLTITYEYVTVCPAVVTTAGRAVFSSSRLGAAATVTVTVDGSESTAEPVGGVPEATDRKRVV